MVSSVDSGQSSALDPDRLADSYNTGLRKVLDRHAPSVTRRVRDRPSSPWLSGDVRDARRKRRAAERRWRKSGLTIHRQMFVHQRSAVVAVIEQAKRQYYDDKINSTSSSKQLFAAFSELQGKSRTTPLPTSIPRRDLPQKFSLYVSVTALYVSVPALYVSVTALYVSVPALYVSVTALYVSVPALYVSVPALYVSVPALYVSVTALYVSVTRTL
nr:hypothetical protein BaRGS_034007 [Batillaria attramentaria]